MTDVFTTADSKAQKIYALNRRMLPELWDHCRRGSCRRHRLVREVTPLSILSMADVIEDMLRPPLKTDQGAMFGPESVGSTGEIA